MKGTGILFVYTSGKTDRFCSRKCEKNKLHLGRKSLKTKWTKTYHAEKQKRAGAKTAKA